jgi:uncharacterized membrane protein
MRARGQVIVWVAVLLPLFLAIAGLVIDAGQLFDARREAQNVADGAARVAVEQINRSSLSNRGVLQLDFTQAQAAATQYVRNQEQGPGWQAPNITPEYGRGNTVTGVTVSVTRQVPTSFMRIVKALSTVTVGASARAEACVGLGTVSTNLAGGGC